MRGIFFRDFKNNLPYLCYKQGTKTSKTEITKKKERKRKKTKKTFVPFNLNVRLLKLESLRLTGCETEHPAYLC